MHVKEEKFLIACMHLLRLEVIRGHLKWTVVELSKLTHCSRVWLYSNFGNTKKKMLENAVKIYLEDFYGFSSARQALSRDSGYMGSLWKSRTGLEKFPEILVFYYTHRNRDSSIGTLIRSAEDRYLAALRDKFGMSQNENLAFIRTFLHGLCTAFFLNREETDAAFAVFMEMLITQRLPKVAHAATAARS